MSDRFAIIDGGAVANIVLASAEFAASQGWIAAPDHASPGDLYDAETGAFSRPTPPLIPLADQIATATLAIDAAADSIRNAVLGGRTTEYQEALADAQAFADGGYTADPPPPGVKSWLDAKIAVGAGWTAQQAADDILTTAAQWKAAQDAIRAARLLRKEQVRVATTAAQVEAALSAWQQFAAWIRSQLGV